MKGHKEIILYQPEETVKLDVHLVDETVWLNRQQIAELFDRDIKTIGKHINNALKEELADMVTVAKFATVQKEGDRTITRQVEYYNLDMILSIGYRVKSHRGVQFRQWANKVLKEYLLKGYAINQRLMNIEQRIDNKLLEHEQRLNQIDQKIDFFVRTSLPPVEGFFFNGQIFDAYVFSAQLVKSARSSLVLIDNYVDESVLLLFSKRSSGVKATIYTKQITPQLHLDLNRYNSQYSHLQIEVRLSQHMHDRFLIIDNTKLYHIGASLKDLGKKLFTFSKMNMPASTITKIL